MKQKLLSSFRLRVVMLVAILCSAFTGHMLAQTVAVNDVLWTESFSNGSSSSSFSATTSWANYINPSTFVSTDASSLTYTSSNAMASSGTATNMDGTNVWLNKGTTGYIQVSGIKLYNTKKIKVSWAQSKGAAITVSYQFDGQGSFTNLSTSTTAATAEFESDELDVSDKTTIALKFTRGSNNSNVRIDDLTVTATEVISSGPATYSVTYDKNGDDVTGSVPTDNTAYSSGATVTVLGNTGSLAKAGYTFGGWNTQDDGNGTTYSAGNTFTISANTTLYAKWNAKTITSLSYTGTPTKTEYNAGETFDATGMTVTATFNDESSEDVTSSVTWTPSPLTVGTTSVTGTYMGINITVNGLTVTAAPGTADNPYTVAQANEATPASGTSANVYIHGIVSGFYGTNTDITGDNYHRYYISDDGTSTDQLLVFNGKGLNNVAFSNADDLMIGDEITICGGLTTFEYAPEVAKDNYIVSLTRKEVKSIALSGTYTTTFVEGSEFNHEGVVVTATYDDNSTADVSSQATFSEPDMTQIGEQTITVTFNGKTATYDITITELPTHTATFSVNGTTSTQEFKEGAAITFPADPADISGKVFMGWTDAAISGTTDIAPSFVSSATMGNADVTFYAVFASEVAGGSTDIVLDNTTIVSNASGKGSYSNNYSINGWTGRYMINNSSGTYSLQLGYNTDTSKSAHNSHLTTPNCSGNITSITLETQNNTASGRTFYLCSANDLGCATNEDAIYGSGSTSTVNGSVTINVTGNTNQFHIYPNGTAYLKTVTLTYSTASYSDYCTTVLTTGTITLNSACNDDGVIYGTFYTDHAYVMPENLDGSVVKVDDDGKLVVQAVYEGTNGDVVPAYTALLINSYENFTGTKDYTIFYTNESGVDHSSDNMLKGTLTADDMTEGDNCLFYRLTMHGANPSNNEPGTIGFWWGASDGGTFKPGANKAYLAVPKTDGARISGFAFGEDGTTTAIEDVRVADGKNAVYNLNGQRVAQPQKGMYIVNGKKVIK